MRRVEFEPDARRDVALARDWYAQRQEGLDLRYRECIDDTFARIAAFPESHVLLELGVRRAQLTGPFPFSVYYRAGGGAIRILAVLHNSRNPDRWRDRAE